jgi:4-alpha-glucanotransferase
MAEANVLSYRVLFFEQADDGKFRPPEEYPRLAVSVAGSHDMPPLRGWLGAADITLKERLGLYGSPA